MQLIKFRKYIQSCLLSSALMVSAAISAPIERAAAEEANKTMAADGEAEKTKSKTATKQQDAKKKKSHSVLEKKLHKLHNLYVPMHWTDYASGMAIGGFDPLSYFFNEKSEIGDERFQYLWHGVTWQFSSEANLLAFKRTPSSKLNLVVD